MIEDEPCVVEEACTKEAEAPLKKDNNKRIYYTKYSVVNGNKFYPIPETADKLPPGYYAIQDEGAGYFAGMLDYSDSELIRFPDTMADELIEEYQVFWGLKEQYVERGEQHKRGYLLHGPPGGGKTCLVKIMMQDFINKGNIVFRFNPLLKAFLPSFRQIQPDQKIMIIMEDVDTLIARNGYENEILEFLDGGTPLHDTVIVATTNYIERLPHRIKNRPSRFDRVAKIGFPTADQRTIYFAEKALKMPEHAYPIERWVRDTENFSFAHVKELILGVEVYGKKYEEVLKRLKDMQLAEESSADYEKKFREEKTLGFAGGNSKVEQAQPLHINGN